MNIKRVTALGSGKRPSTVEFRQGLNIIEGKSNTGKSCVLKSIDFCLGSKDNPFDRTLGYDKIVLELSSPFGDIEIARKFDENKVNIVTSVPGIDNDEYPIASRKSDKKNLSDILLAGIGIQERHHIISNVNYKRQQLTWRTLNPLILYSADTISNEKSSVIMPEPPSARTAFLSALLFLLTGDDLSNLKEQDSRDIKIAKKAAVTNYINTRLQWLSKAQESLQGQVAKLGAFDLGQKLKDTLSARDVISDKLQHAGKRSESLVSRISVLKENIIKCQLTILQYHDLKSQYIADVKRLTNIIEAEDISNHSRPILTKCPFCDHEIKQTKRKSYTKAAEAELKTTLASLDGLKSALSETEDQEKKLNSELQIANSELSKVKAIVDQTLQPELEKINQDYRKYLDYQNLQSELSSITQQAQELLNDQKNLDSESEVNLQYRPKERLKKPLAGLDNLISAILKESQFVGSTLPP